ncbi:adenosine receptor A2b-like [Haliotis rubra]|uniref:adenosine receptor A2b-like n=1 Tax=Haliotis rubra TaxID=36100 RepID=UPI001EE607AD|nr:adenosine receptor A2b-like [Haliotis rubra]
MTSAWIVLGLFLNYLLVIFILTVNIIVVVVLVQNASLHSPSNVIIGTLAVADLGFGLIRTVLVLLEYKTFRSYWTCLVSYCIAIFLGSVSMHMLVIVSIDRYILITRPLHYYNIINNTRISIAISCSVVFCFFISFTPVLGVVREDFDASVCSPEFFLVPVIALSCRHRVDAETGNNGNNQLAAHLKAAKLLATLCGYFLLSWGPYVIVKLISYIRDRTPLRDEINHMTDLLAVSNSLGNPLIYAFRSVDVKHKLQRMFTSTWNRPKPIEENQVVPTIRVSTEDVE